LLEIISIKNNSFADINKINKHQVVVIRAKLITKSIVGYGDFVSLIEAIAIDEPLSFHLFVLVVLQSFSDGLI